MNPIGVNGLDFIHNGERWIYRGATNFLLFLRYLLGEDIEPLLYPGAELYEVFGLCHYIPSQIGLRDLSIDDEDRYFTSLGEFAQYLEQRGKRMGFCLFTCPDVRYMGIPHETRLRYWARTLEVLGRTPHLIRRVNEQWQDPHFDDVDYPFPQTPITVPICWGDSDDWHLSPLAITRWAWMSHHPRRDYPKHIKNCQSTEIAEMLARPFVMTEPFKAAEFTDNIKHYNNPRYFYQAACLMRSGAGGSFHSVDGAYSRPLGDWQEACREAFFEGLG